MFQRGQERAGLSFSSDGSCNAQRVRRSAWWLEQTKTISTSAESVVTVSPSLARSGRIDNRPCKCWKPEGWEKVHKRNQGGALSVIDAMVEEAVVNRWSFESAHFSTIKRALKRVFGCWHREMSLPFTRGNETYRTCVNCGARRRFDLERWTMVGEFYRPQSRSDLTSAR